MKIRCNICGKVVTIPKESFDRTVKKLHIDKDDFVSIYLCKKCSLKLCGSNILDWDRISLIPKLSEQFIEKYKDKVDWHCISRYQKLSEKFIEKYKDYVDWYFISEYQKLSERFIEKYKDKVDWNNVSRYQNLSVEFVVKHIDKITEDIFGNPCYENYPDSLKLLLKQKFNK